MHHGLLLNGMIDPDQVDLLLDLAVLRMGVAKGTVRCRAILSNPKGRLLSRGSRLMLPVYGHPPMLNRISQVSRRWP